jgi:hypothetical protein
MKAKQRGWVDELENERCASSKCFMDYHGVHAMETVRDSQGMHCFGDENDEMRMSSY